MATIKHQHPSYGEIEFKVFRPVEVKIDGKSCMSPACRTKRGDALNGALTKAAARVRQGLAETRRPAPTPQTKASLPPEAYVPVWRAHEAAEVARWAADQWGVAPPTVKFFDAAQTDYRGKFFTADPTSIYVATEVRGASLTELVLHECAHHARYHLGLENNEAVVADDVTKAFRTLHLLHLKNEETRRWANYGY